MGFGTRRTNTSSPLVQTVDSTTLTFTTTRPLPEFAEGSTATTIVRHEHSRRKSYTRNGFRGLVGCVKVPWTLRHWTVPWTFYGFLFCWSVPDSVLGRRMSPRDASVPHWRRKFTFSSGGTGRGDGRRQTSGSGPLTEKTGPLYRDTLRSSGRRRAEVVRECMTRTSSCRSVSGVSPRSDLKNPHRNPTPVFTIFLLPLSVTMKKSSDLLWTRVKTLKNFSLTNR